MKSFDKVLSHRFGPVFLLVLLLLVLSFLTRVVLLIKSHVSFDFTVMNLSGVFLIGLFYDFVNASYFTIPLTLYIWLMPERIFFKSWHKFVLLFVFSLFACLLLFNAASEWFFWDEFNTRFNFIAVDYLVYTTEVLGNIRQSYPIELILVFIVLLGATIVFLAKPAIYLSTTSSLGIKKRTGWALGIFALPVFFFLYRLQYDSSVPTPMQTNWQVTACMSFLLPIETMNWTTNSFTRK